MTVNRERSRSVWEHRAATRAKREQAGWLAKAALPRLGRVMVEARPQQARGRLADAGAHLPTVKACVDGLVDAGRLEDDSPPFVTGLLLVAPCRGEDGVWLVFHPQVA